MQHLVQRIAKNQGVIVGSILIATVWGGASGEELVRECLEIHSLRKNAATMV